MSISATLDFLENLTLAQAVGGNVPGFEWSFPIIETVHVFALATVFGSIVMIDLRLLGISSRDSLVSKLSQEVLPWTWIAFAVAVLSGSLMFVSKATIYWHNTQFQLKFLAMFLAGLNMLAFHFGVNRRLAQWDAQLPTPLAARVAGGLSVALWIFVLFMGRWIGFTT